MLDLRLIRREPDALRAALARRGAQPAERLDRVLELDARWREARQAAEALRAEQKAASEEVAAGKRENRDVSTTLERLKT
ncbi:MAG TPA: serine--tRNA ligase, partial [Solirubrobacteraceae bacterium]|nr:serine--tRNA ligase [Solirubrobacteraceae bacterium]